MIWLVDNKYKQVLYEHHINKHEEINQQVKDAKQVKTSFLRIYFGENCIHKLKWIQTFHIACIIRLIYI
jgi:hypothetical protein